MFIGALGVALVKGVDRPEWPCRIIGKTHCDGREAWTVKFYGTYEVSTVFACNFYPISEKNVDRFKNPNWDKVKRVTRNMKKNFEIAFDDIKTNPDRIDVLGKQKVKKLSSSLQRLSLEEKDLQREPVLPPVQQCRNKSFCRKQHIKVNDQCFYRKDMAAYDEEMLSWPG